MTFHGTSPQPSTQAANTTRLVIGLRANSRTSGGGLVFFRELATALVGHPDVDVVIFATGGRSAIIWPEGATIVSVPTPKSRHLARLRATHDLQRCVDEHPVDVLICPGTEVTPVKGPTIAVWPLTVAPFEADALKQLGDSLRQRLRWAILRQLVKRACRRADFSFFSSAYARDLHQRSIQHLRTVPAFVAHPAASLPNATDDSWVEGETEHLLFVSHLYPYKMVVEMVESYGDAARVNEAVPPLIIAGGMRDAAYATRVERARVASGVAHKIQLVGEKNQSELHDLYKKAQAFIFPSISENAGSYALIDAFAYGVPVISSNASSMPEICGDSALMVDPRDRQALTESILRVATNQDAAKELAALSLARTSWFPTWPHIAELVVAGCTAAQPRDAR